MSSAIGPRMYLVGQILNGLVQAAPEAERKALVLMAIEMADDTIDHLYWPEGIPESDGEMP